MAPRTILQTEAMVYDLQRMIAPTGAAVLSATIAMVSFQMGATFAKQLIPAIGAPGTTQSRGRH
jgi:threonine/homoserine efflux transporter RhtA